jgi:hypothetical protein
VQYFVIGRNACDWAQCLAPQRDFTFLGIVESGIAQQRDENDAE